MEYIELKAEIRTTLGKGYSKKIRRTGKVPAVVYGLGKDNKAVELVIRDVDKVLKTQLGMNNLIHLSYASGGDDKVMIKDYQGDPISRALTHVDLIRVDESKEVLLSIPVKYVGRAEGIKEGGVEDRVSRDIELYCRPGYIPLQVEVDITPLKVGQSLHLKDIQLPANTRAATGYNPTLITIFLPKAEEEAKPEDVAAAAVTAAPGAAAAAGDAAKAGDAKAAPAAAPAAAKGGDKKK